jgi:acetate kinase
MKAEGPVILALNGGSSSIRFDVFHAGKSLQRGLHGKLERIGAGDAKLHFSDAGGAVHKQVFAQPGGYPEAASALLDWLESRDALGTLSAIGHRLVHGMGHTRPELVTPALMEELRRMAWIDPDHLPGEMALIEALRLRAPTLAQVVCFDTAFHSRMPLAASQLAIPRRLQDLGARRYGFHGLSYAYLMEELARLEGAAAAQGRVILAHLGNGASMAAVRGGVGIDTSMGLTPASGLPMGTRSGDVDPGLALYLQKSAGMDSAAFDHMVNHEAGLLGVSQTSADMRDLLAVEATDTRAAEAVALFCYQAKKYIGAGAAALGGLDTLVFSGGIGENAAAVRTRICEGLVFLGITLDAQRNGAHAGVISTDASAVTVRVIPTDESLMIAQAVCGVIGHVIAPAAPSK